MKNELVKIYVGGTFDMFHFGHVRLLKYAKSIKNSFVIVALNGDDFSRFYKGKVPVMNEMERLEAISSCKYVDMVFVMESKEKQAEYIKTIRPNFILHGSDWSGKSLLDQLSISDEFLKDNDIRMLYAPYTSGISTTDIKKRFLEEEDLDLR